MKKLGILFLIVHGIQLNAYIHFKTPREALSIAVHYLPANPVIFEAGAYNGEDTLEVLRFFNFNAVIHSFEPIPYLYGLLGKKSLQYPNNIRTYPYAVSDSNGEACMYVSEESYAPDVPSQSSSLLAPKEHLNYSGTLFKKEIVVPTITIDTWAEEKGVDHIDFMWLDMQGYELNALKASPHILKTVKVILTEVEFVEAYAGQYQFKDVKEWLESQGFIMIAENFGEYGNWFGDALFVRV